MFINKDGALIPTPDDLEMTMRYSEFSGRKLVNEKFTQLDLAETRTPTFENTVYVNPCEQKLLQCYSIFSDDTINSGYLEILSSGSVLVHHNFITTPVSAGIPLTMEVTNTLTVSGALIDSNNPVWLYGSGTVTIALTLEMHEVFRWTD